MTALICANARVTRYCAWCDGTEVPPVGRCACGGYVETTYAHTRAPERVSGFYRRFWEYLPLEGYGLPDLDLRSRTIPAPFIRELVGGAPVYLKIEADLPTGSTKDRAAAVAIPYLRQHGVSELVMSSTGNTSTAYAYMARHFPDVLIHIFMGRDFAYRLAHVQSPNIAVHMVDGNFVQAGAAGQRYAKEHGLFWEGGFFNPGRRDGLKTTLLEATEDIGEVPRHYVQAVSSGMGVLGVLKAAGEISEPRDPDAEPVCVPLCVQQSSCGPMVSAWNAGRATIAASDKIPNPTGIAKAILRGDPTDNYPAMHRAVSDNRGQFVAVDSGEITAARRLIYRELGISVCEASAAALAGYLTWMSRSHELSRGPVLINLTGSDRNEIHR